MRKRKTKRIFTPVNNIKEFLEVLKKAGLTTPFEEETFKKVAATMLK